MPFDGDRERDKAWRMLVRRGYEPEIAYEAVRRHERGLDRPPDRPVRGRRLHPKVPAEYL